MRPKVLFLCTGNSCRSQIAEGWARHLLGDRIDAYSAGTAPQPLNQTAVSVMQEIGIDISGHTPKSLTSLGALRFDLVVTVCDNAAQSCPTPTGGARIIHAPFDDPPQLARSAGSAEEALQHFRRVRDEIKEFVRTVPALLG